MDTSTAVRQPLFSRATLLIVALLCCFATLVATSLANGASSTATLPLPAVLLTLLFVLPVGEFIRIRFRLSLGALLLLITFVALLLGLFGARWTKARRQRLAVKAVQTISILSTPDIADRVFVSVQYNRTSDFGDDWIRTPEGWLVPAWLVDLLGSDFFFDTVEVSIQFADLTAHDALADVDLALFEQMHFNECSFGAEAIDKVVAVQGLRQLHFTNCGITDEHLEKIATIPKLESLYLVNFMGSIHANNVSTKGIREIAGITTLKHLNLENLGIGPGELEPLKNLTKLEWLNVSGNKLLCNDDARIVLGLPNLRGVDFGLTKIDESVLPTFRSIPQLEWATIPNPGPDVVNQIEASEHPLKVYVR